MEGKRGGVGGWRERREEKDRPTEGQRNVQKKGQTEESAVGVAWKEEAWGWVPPPLTDGQGHHPEAAAHQFYHLALLQRRGSAADHSLAASSQLQEPLLQTLLQDELQGLPCDNECSPKP